MQELRKFALLLGSTIPRLLAAPTSSVFESIHDLKTLPTTQNVPCYRVHLSVIHFHALIAPHLPNPDPSFELSNSAPVMEAAGDWRHWLLKRMVEMNEVGNRLASEWEMKEKEKEERRTAMLAKSKARALLNRGAGSSDAGLSGARVESRKSKGKAMESDAAVTDTEEEDRSTTAPCPNQSTSHVDAPSPLPRRHGFFLSNISPASSTDDDNERAPPTSKSPRTSKQQQSPGKNKALKPASEVEIALEPQSSYLEIYSDEEEEDDLPMPSPSKLGRLNFPSASTSTSSSATKTFSSHTYIPSFP